jgi:phospholipid/cholesterol/gamma-HCH transport system permease protein
MANFAARALLLGRTARAVARRGLPVREVWAQLAEIGAGSLVVIAVGLAFFGAAMVTSAEHEAKPIVQDIAVVGPPYFHLLVREFAPILVGALCALKVGSMVAAELGTMAQTEQLEALEMSAGDPLSELVAPRLVAGVLALPVLLCVGLLSAATSAALCATFAFGSDGWAWLDPLVTSRTDVVLAFTKVALFGLAIPLAACVEGLRAQGGASAVGRATTRGAVDAFLSMLAIDVLFALGAGLAGL